MDRFLLSLSDYGLFDQIEQMMYEVFLPNFVRVLAPTVILGFVFLIVKKMLRSRIENQSVMTLLVGFAALGYIALDGWLTWTVVKSISRSILSDAQQVGTQMVETTSDMLDMTEEEYEEIYGQMLGGYEFHDPFPSGNSSSSVEPESGVEEDSSFGKEP